jgi:hypothetical protein
VESVALLPKKLKVVCMRMDRDCEIQDEVSGSSGFLACPKRGGVVEHEIGMSLCVEFQYSTKFTSIVPR